MSYPEYDHICLTIYNHICLPGLLHLSQYLEAQITPGLSSLLCGESMCLLCCSSHLCHNSMGYHCVELDNNSLPESSCPEACLKSSRVGFLPKRS